jgi:hypothetical protein
METRHLIDAIVQQTTLLIAQLSTAAGIRAPLARLADQVFLELSRELEAQGVTRKVAADMFGLALRSYQKKIHRLSESATQREQTRAWRGSRTTRRGHVLLRSARGCRRAGRERIRRRPRGHSRGASMKQAWIWVLAPWASMAVLGLSLACGKATMPLPDKNTNWLKRCDADAECGSALACLCGACSKSCKANSDCKGADPDATCVATGDPAVLAACGPQPSAAALCTLSCKRDADCGAPADGMVCTAGLCVAAPNPACDQSACEAISCKQGQKSFATCAARGSVSRCSCVAEQPATCAAGEVTATICELGCLGFHATAFATCNPDGHFGPCTCANPDCGPGLNCASGFTCFEERCLPVPDRCADRVCEAGFTCSQGVCFQVLADGQSSPTELAVNDTHVYFVNTGTYMESGEFNFDSDLVEVPIGGGPVRRVGMDLNEIGKMLMDDTRAYWLNTRFGSAFQINSWPLRDGIGVALWNTDNAVSGLVQDAENLYWLSQPEPNASVELRRARKDGTGEVATLHRLSEPSTTLALRGDAFYWGDSATGLWTANKDGSSAKRVYAPVAGAIGPLELAADDSGVYWSWAREAKLGLVAFVRSPDVRRELTMPLEGMMAQTLALDPTHIYWLYSDFDGSSYQLVRTDKNSADTRVVWESPLLRSASQIVVRGDYIYMTSRTEAPGNGVVLRLAKPGALR